MNRIDRRIRTALVLMLPLGAALCCATPGCVNENKSKLQEQSDQRTITPTKTQQEQATQGNQTYVWTIIENAPARQTNGGRLPLPGGNPMSLNNASGAAGGSLASSDAGYVMAGINVNIPVTNGGTAPSNTGTTTGSASASQTPTATQTASPTQRNQHELTASTPIAVGAAPGTQIDQQASATGRGTTTGQTKTNDQDQRIEQLNAKVDNLTRLIDRLSSTPAPTDADDEAADTVPPPAPSPAPAPQPAPATPSGQTGA